MDTHTNIHVVKNKWKNDTEQRFKRITNTLSPVMKLCAQPFFNDLKQINNDFNDTILRGAKTYAVEPLVQITEKHFPLVAAHGTLKKVLQQIHADVSECEDFILEWFVSKLIIGGELLQSDALNYEQLIKNRFRSKNDAEKILSLELLSANKAIAYFASHMSHFTIPVGIKMDTVVTIFNNELEYSWHQFHRELEKIYQQR